MLSTMTSLEAFLARCDAVAARMGITRSALSNRLLFDSRRLDLIEQGKDIGVRRLARAEETLAEMEIAAAVAKDRAERSHEAAA